jgi:hypothetical protein
MVSSKAPTVQQYLRDLPADRRAVVSTVRKTIVKNLPKGYREAMGFGMISYELPLERLPNTYNKQPLCYAALAAQKNHFAVYLMGAYIDPKQVRYLKDEFRKRGKKLDMGRSCLRFRKLDDIDLDVIGTVIASTPPEKLIALYQEIHPAR